MKLILKNGEVETEIKEITGISNECDLLIIKSHSHLRPVDIEKCESYLSSKTGKKVVILQPCFGEVLGIK